MSKHKIYLFYIHLHIAWRQLPTIFLVHLHLENMYLLTYLFERKLGRSVCWFTIQAAQQPGLDMAMAGSQKLFLMEGRDQALEPSFSALAGKILWKQNWDTVQYPWMGLRFLIAFRVFISLFIWKVEFQTEGGRESSIHWFIPWILNDPSHHGSARSKPGPKSFIQAPHLDAGIQALDTSSDAFSDALSGSRIGCQAARTSIQMGCGHCRQQLDPLCWSWDSAFLTIRLNIGPFTWVLTMIFHLWSGFKISTCNFCCPSKKNRF